LWAAHDLGGGGGGSSTIAAAATAAAATAATTPTTTTTTSTRTGGPPPHEAHVARTATPVRAGDAVTGARGLVEDAAVLARPQFLSLVRRASLVLPLGAGDARPARVAHALQLLAVAAPVGALQPTMLTLAQGAGRAGPPGLALAWRHHGGVAGRWGGSGGGGGGSGGGGGGGSGGDSSSSVRARAVHTPRRAHEPVRLLVELAVRS
jgi:hypothetical protein